MEEEFAHLADDDAPDSGGEFEHLADLAAPVIPTVGARVGGNAEAGPQPMGASAPQGPDRGDPSNFISRANDAFGTAGHALEGMKFKDTAPDEPFLVGDNGRMPMAARALLNLPTDAAQLGLGMAALPGAATAGIAGNLGDAMADQPIAPGPRMGGPQLNSDGSVVGRALGNMADSAQRAILDPVRHVGEEIGRRTWQNAGGLGGFARAVGSTLADSPIGAPAAVAIPPMLGGTLAARAPGVARAAGAALGRAGRGAAGYAGDIMSLPPPIERPVQGPQMTQFQIEGPKPTDGPTQFREPGDRIGLPMTTDAPFGTEGPAMDVPRPPEPLQLPPGTGQAQVPNRTTLDPKTGEVLEDSRGATGETLRVPPGGFNAPKFEMKPEPKLLPESTAIPIPQQAIRPGEMLGPEGTYRTSAEQGAPQVPPGSRAGVEQPYEGGQAAASYPEGQGSIERPPGTGAGPFDPDVRIRFDSAPPPMPKRPNQVKVSRPPAIVEPPAQTGGGITREAVPPPPLAGEAAPGASANRQAIRPRQDIGMLTDLAESLDQIPQPQKPAYPGLPELERSGPRQRIVRSAEPTRPSRQGGSAIEVGPEGAKLPGDAAYEAARKRYSPTDQEILQDLADVLDRRKPPAPGFAPKVPGQGVPPPPVGRKDTPDTMIPELPPMVESDLEHPRRGMNAWDAGVSRATASGNYLGPTDKQIPGSGGAGVGGLLAERKSRAEWIARTIEERVNGPAREAGIREGDALDLAATRVADGSGTAADRRMVDASPAAKALVERWTKLRDEAVAHPDMEMSGFIKDYVTQTRDSTQPMSFARYLMDLERGSGAPKLKADPLTSYLQVSRANAPDSPPSIMRAARVYNRAVAFELEMKPGLKKVTEWMNARGPEGEALVDPADQQIIQNYVNDAYLGREQVADAIVRKTPGIKQATAAYNFAKTRIGQTKLAAGLNSALETIGLPTVDYSATQNPLKSVMSAGRGLANVTLVRPAAAALSHFLGDAWPKMATKGAKAGIFEYADGAKKALVDLGAPEWDRLEQLGVAERLPEGEFASPILKGLSTGGKRFVTATRTVDTASKVGTFYAELGRLVDGGMAQAEAESLAATITRARNYYPNAVNSIPLAAGRVTGAFYQFLKPGLNGLDNIKSWIGDKNGAALVRTGLGAVGLAALGAATGTDILHRVHILPTDIKPAILEPAPRIGALDFTDPFGVADKETRKQTSKERSEAKRLESYNNRRPR